jgi:hypothetical protein
LDRTGLQLVRRTAVFHYTPAATEVNTEYLVLGSLGIDDARIVPSASILRFTGTGTIDAKFTLKKLSTAAVQTTISAATATVAALTAPVVLAAPVAAGDLVVLDQSDKLILTFTTGASAVTLPITMGIIAEIAYDAPA